MHSADPADLLRAPAKPGLAAAHHDIIMRGDPRIAGYAHDTMLIGDPDAVVRPTSAGECAELLQYSDAHRVPVTVCAGHTAMTGSAVAESGLVLSVERMTGIVDLGTCAGRPFVRARPGIFLAELQDAVAAAGYFYPPSPTSRREAMLGGTIATNATGDTTYKYGTTRRYVRAIEVLLASGERRVLERPRDHYITELKSTAGYFLHGCELDYFVGAEGTLGLITEVTLDLLSHPQPQFGLFVFFPDRRSALACIHRVDAEARLRPAALEYIDGDALAVMATHPTFPGIPTGAGAALIVYQEYPEELRDPLVGQWFDTLADIDPRMTTLVEHAIIATQPADLERFQQWRHRIPALVNEEGHRLEVHGGGKVGTDWWVPIAQMPTMMDWMYERSEALGISFLAFGHLGNGHPHVNYLTRTPDEKRRAATLVHESCREAVRRGGGVAGEHGLGKLKRDLLAIQHPPEIIARMHALKSHYDPHWLLGRGNIFAPPR